MNERDLSLVSIFLVVCMLRGGFGDFGGLLVNSSKFALKFGDGQKGIRWVIEIRRRGKKRSDVLCFVPVMLPQCFLSDN